MQAVDRLKDMGQGDCGAEGRFGRLLQKGGRDVEHIGSLGGKQAPRIEFGG